MHPGIFAASRPQHAAVVLHPSGATQTYAELDAAANRIAHVMRELGLTRGDRIAILLPNHPRYLEIAWAAQRSGLYYVPVNHHLTPAETAYIVSDCGARLLVGSADLLAVVAAEASDVEHVVTVDGDLPGAHRYHQLCAAQSAEPLPDAAEGAWMFYSSGTTGRPKGIVPGAVGAPLGTVTPFDRIVRDRFGYDDDLRYLVSAPLYHAAPLGWSMAAHRVGGTVVVLESFDAEQCLAAIEQHRITHAQFVPTHFVRMLKLPEAVRNAYDLSSLQVVIHAAAPCPVEVKEAMIDWLGPIVTEFYSGSEGIGFCMISTDEWLAHRGSVGRPALGIPHILDDQGRELTSGQVGEIWFETPATFAYHGDPDKTAGAWNDRGWATFGDLGSLADDGYLYLADRRADLVISGGVNVYPREAEDVLILHPAIIDVACVGVPDTEYGQVLVAAVQPAVAAASGEDLLTALDGFVRERLSGFKCPRRYVVLEEIPRLPTGKVLRRELLSVLENHAT
ncbi:MAG TPA: AMP-binding protein [Sporichthyaceae bacterium]